MALCALVCSPDFKFIHDLDFGSSIHFPEMRYTSTAEQSSHHALAKGLCCVDRSQKSGLVPRFLSFVVQQLRSDEVP